jgi:ketosteroid isomerase-like protein
MESATKPRDTAHTMSEENVERYYRVIDAFNRRDLDASLALLDPDVDFAPRSVALEGGRSFRGHDGFRTWWESTFTAFSDYVAEIEEVRDFGDVTVSRLRFRGHGMESNVPIDEMQWHVVEWRHRLIARLRTLRGEAEALEAAGLSE